MNTSSDIAKVRELLAKYRTEHFRGVMLPGTPAITAGMLADVVEPMDWEDAATEAGWLNPANTSPGTIAAWCERHRQQASEGFTAEDDDKHVNGELAAAAICYILPFIKGLAPEQLEELTQAVWPFAPAWLKQDLLQHDLAKAGALVAAEYDRLERKQALEVRGQDE